MTGKRKFVAYLATLVLSSLLCYAGSVKSEDYKGLVNMCLLAFVVGNGAEHWMNKDK